MPLLGDSAFHFGKNPESPLSTVSCVTMLHPLAKPTCSAHYRFLESLAVSRASLRIRVNRECAEEAQHMRVVKSEEAEGAGWIRPSTRRCISHKRPNISSPSFESRLPEGAEKCLAFLSSGKTRLPAKPCGPASPFLGLATAPWEGCEEERALFNDHGKDNSGCGPKPEHLQDAAAKQRRVAEKMKMWPSMHDLPTQAPRGRRPPPRCWRRARAARRGGAGQNVRAPSGGGVPMEPLSEVPHAARAVRWSLGDKAWRMQCQVGKNRKLGRGEGLEAGGGPAQAAGDGEGAG